MMRFASLFVVLQSSALKTAIVKKNRRENFASSMLKGMNSLDAVLSKWVDDNFWD